MHSLFTSKLEEKIALSANKLKSECWMVVFDDRLGFVVNLIIYAYDKRAMRLILIESGREFQSFFEEGYGDVKIQINGITGEERKNLRYCENCSPLSPDSKTSLCFFILQCTSKHGSRRRVFRELS